MDVYNGFNIKQERKMKTVKFEFDISGQYSAFEDDNKIHSSLEGTYVPLEVAERLLEALESLLTFPLDDEIREQGFDAIAKAKE